MKKIPKLTLMSTSNGLIKGGVSTKLSEYFFVKNLSMGACSSGIGLYNLYNNKDVFDSDYIILDYSINDNEHVNNEWISKEHAEETAEKLYSILSMSTAKVFVLLMPVYHYLSNYLDNKGVELHLKLAEKYRFPIINGYDFVSSNPLNDKSSLFMDFAHLDRKVAYSFGEVIVDYISSYENIISTESYDQKLSDIKTILPDKFKTDGVISYKGSSLGVYQCVSLDGNSVINIDIPDGFKVDGIVINANSKAKISIKYSQGRLIKNIYSGALPDDKVQIKYIPFYNSIVSSWLEIKVACFDDEVTEKSPASWKVLDGLDYGDCDVFGILLSRVSIINLNERVVEQGNFICSPSYRPISSVRESILNDIEVSMNRGISHGEMADLLRELAIFFESHNRIYAAEKAIDFAEKNRPSGTVIKSIKNRIKDKKDKREKLFKSKP